MNGFFINDAGERRVEITDMIRAQQHTALMNEMVFIDDPVIKHRFGESTGKIAADTINKIHAAA